MFSPAERNFLRTMVERSIESDPSKVDVQFRNPAYRRKLLWGIRRKAGRSLADWQLYLEAAHREPRILPRADPDEPGSAPLFADPLVTLFQDLRRKLARRRQPPETRAGREE